MKYATVMQTTKVSENSTAGDQLITNRVKSQRKYSLPVKLIVGLTLAALAISSLLIVSIFNFPLITLGALLLGLTLFLVFVRPKKLSFIQEEYAPDYFISEAPSIRK